MLQLLSATPSPYARKVRIALLEKGIPFELITEVPWDSTTKTPQYNPLQKIPVLILNKEHQNGNGADAPTPSNSSAAEDEGDAVYESAYILEYLELRYPTHYPLLTLDTSQHLLAKKVEVVADGVCDALVLVFFERQRAEGAQSKEWSERQMRKVDAGLKTLQEWATDKDGQPKDFIVGGRFGLADVAAGACCGYINVRFSDYKLEEKLPVLGQYWRRLEERESFKSTVPRPQKINDKIV